MAEFEITRPGGQCSVSGRALAEGEVFHTVLFETPGGFERRDIAEESWDGPPEGAFCHFKTRLPEKTRPRKVFVDNDVLVGFFERLDRTDDPSKLRLRFVLALMLMRKRLLKYETTNRDGGKEIWRMRLTRDKSLHQVLNPDLGEDQIQALTGELSVLLASHVEQDAVGETLDQTDGGDGVGHETGPAETASE